MKSSLITVQENQLKNNRILIIEDSNKDLTDRICSFLTKQGFEVKVATDIRNAYAIIEEFNPELIILGKITPEDINHICNQLRRTFDALILMIGTVDGGEAWSESVDAGADFYLVHPFSYLELAARIKSLLRRQISSNMVSTAK